MSSPHAPAYPSFEQIDACLNEWAAAAGGKGMSLSVEARSPQDRPVYAITLTDPAYAARDKQHVVLAAVDSGVERSATATLFGLMHWLLSGAPAAHEVLSRQVIVCVPVFHPDEYEHGGFTADKPRFRLLSRMGWGPQGVKDPAAFPEAAGLQAVIDRHQPDVFVDVHGVSLDFERYLMVESSATSPGWITKRPYHQRIARLMDEAALEAGFPSDLQEDDREVQYGGPEVEQLGTKLWKGRAGWSPGLYAYGQFHTLQLTLEVTWQHSGVARLQRLLRIGQERWEGELYPGYPNHVVGGCGPAGLGHTVAAYGQTVAQRRRSRIELWQKHAQLAAARIDPQQVGKAIVVFALSTQARKRWLEAVDSAQGDARPVSTDAMAARFARFPGDPQYLERFIADWPVGQNRPEPHFEVGQGRVAIDDAEPRIETPIEHGAALRLRIPFEDAHIQDLRLNGLPLHESSEDGYTVWRARGFTLIQVNVPPRQSQSDTVYAVTCEYEPGERRPHWTRWLELPPALARSNA